MAKYVQDQYFGVDITQFKENTTFPFNLFIHLPLNERIVPICNKDDLLQDTLVNTLKKQGIQKLFLNIADKYRFEDYLKKPEPAKEEVIEFKVAPEKVMEKILDPRGSAQEEALQLGKQLVAEALHSVEAEDNEEFAEILAMNEAEHSTTVGIYAVLYAIGAGMKTKETLQALVKATLVHDIGLTQIMPELIGIPQNQRTAEQTAQFEKHVEMGQGLLKEMDFKGTAQILELLQDHHEKFDGTGFPRKLAGFKVPDLPQILSLADLTDSIIRGWYDGTPCTFVQALDVIKKIEKKSTFPHYLNPDLFRKIMKWVISCDNQKQIQEASMFVEEAKKEAPELPKAS